jgi:polyisoprenoid-binding protein YceI
VTVRYTFDPQGSRFAAQAFASGMLSVLAHSPTFAVRQFDGEIAFTPETFADASVRVTVQAASLEVTDDLSAKDKAEIHAVTRDQVLEVAAHPQITYRSDAVAVTPAGGNAYRLRFKGKLSLHGVTHDHEVDAQVLVLDGSVRLSGTSTVRQSDYRIKRVKAAAGAITVKDDVKVSFDLVGRKAEGEAGP